MEDSNNNDWLSKDDRGGWREPEAPSQVPGPPEAQGTPTSTNPYSSAGYGVGQGYPAPAPGIAKPDNYLVWAILTTLLCFLPLGVVSIIFAAQVDSKWVQGDAYGAMEASRKARTFAIASAITGVVVTLLVFLLWVIGFALAASGSGSYDSGYS
jgi:hypothetical protein